MLAITILLCLVNVVLALTSVFSNAVVILAIIRTPSLHIPSNILLCNLAFSDLGVGLVVQPLFVTYVVNAKHRDTLLDILGCSSVYFNAASIITMTCIALDRCLALYFHMRYHVVVTTRRILTLIIVMWICDTLALGIFYKGDFQMVNGIVITCCTINCIITFSCYFKINRIVRRHKRQISDQMRALNIPSVRQGRTITTMFFIHGMFVLSMIPFVVTLTYHVATQQNNEVFDSIPIFCTGTLIFVSSAINPYIYCWRIEDVRRAVKKVLRKLKCFGKGNVAPVAVPRRRVLITTIS